MHPINHAMRTRKPTPQELKRQSDDPIPLTKDGIARLENKLALLKRELPDLIAEAQRTAAFGDRSDNAAYKEAKSALRRAQGQIFTLEDQMKRVVVITPNQNIKGIVQLGSTVIVEANRAQRTFQILGSQETDPANGRISYRSPLGAALMHRKQGDTVTIPTKNGSQEYRIIEIR